MADESHITLRACSKCGVEKPATVEHFANYRDRGKIRQKTFCRDCERSRLRAYRAANPERAKEWDRRNQERNRGAGSDYEKRRYARRDKAKAREALANWKAENPDKVRAMWERTYQKNKPVHTKRSREWQRMKRQSDPDFREKCNAANREWLSKNKEKMRPYYRAKAARLRKNDLGYRVMASMRRRVHIALRGNVKSASVSALLGCSLEEAKAHIEQLFTDGMTWENWGRGWGGVREWHLDHVKALSTFDLTDPEQLAQACHYTNLQPLWAKDNLAKGAT